MESTAEGPVVVREIVIAAAPEAVWQFLVDPAKAVRWMGVRATLEPRVGGRYRVEVLPGKVALGEFVEVDPPHRLVHTWGWQGEAGSVPPGSTTVTFDLLPRVRGTLVRVTHSGLSRPSAVDRHTRGWGHYLSRLAAAAARGDAGIDPWIERPEL